MEAQEHWRVSLVDPGTLRCGSEDSGPEWNL